MPTPTTEQNSTLIKASRGISFLETIITPQYQVFVLLFCSIALFFLSEWGLKRQIALEQYPSIVQITEQDYNRWGGEPAVISVGLQINNFPSFNVITDEFILAGKIWFLFDPQLVSLDTVREFSFENQVLLEKHDPEVKLIGDMLFAEFDIRLSFTTELTHRAFPFDSHRIHINLINAHTSPDQAIFESDQSQFVISDQMRIPEWSYKNPTVYTGYAEYTLDTDNKEKTILYPKALFSIDFDRSGSRHIFIMLLPLFLICAVGMIAIGAQKTIGGKSLDINVAGAASIIAYRFVIESMSPKVSYLMVADYVFIFFLIFACMQLIYSSITYQQPPKNSWTIIKGLLFFSFYTGFLTLWCFLIFWWAPSYSSKAKEPTQTKKIDAQKTFSPDLTLKQDPKKQTILVGLLADMSRIDRAFGRQIKNGINTRLFNQNNLPVNFVLDIQDNNASLQKSREIMHEFELKKTTILLSPMGSIIVDAYIDYAKQKKTLILFPVTGSEIVRNPEISHIINFRTSFKNEGTALTNYAVNTLHAQRICFIYEDTPFGKEMLEGAHIALKIPGFSAVSTTEITYEKYDISFEKQIEDLKRSDADTILFLSSGVATVEFINQIGIDHLIGKNLLGTSHLNQSHFRIMIKNKGLTFITTNLVPNPLSSDLSIAQEFRNAANAYKIPTGTFSFESYINTDIMLLIISKITGEITPEKIIQVAEGFKNYDHKGIILDFDPKTRELSPFLWIDTGKDTWDKIRKQG